MSDAPVEAAASTTLEAFEGLVAPQPISAKTFFADVMSLTKPGLSALVMFTASGGLWLSTEPLSLSTWLVTLLATAGTVGAANAFNCYIERDSDRFMARTAKRPLPSGRMDPQFALFFAFALALTSLPALFMGVNAITGVLGLAALLSYVLVYTPMKSRTHWAMLVGAVPGALPPLMGLTAATGSISAPGLALFAILFFWQLPHFIAIALFRKKEYAEAKLTSLPLEKGDAAARAWAVFYLVCLVVVGVLPWSLHVAGPLYLVVSSVLGVIFLGLGIKGWWLKLDAKWARQLFGVSLIYQLGIFAALGVEAMLR